MMSRPPCCSRLPIVAGDGAIVIAPNEFWLNLHRMAEAYEAEGLTTEERGANIVAQFLEMPLIAQRSVLSDLLLVATHIPDLHPLVSAAINEAEAERRLRPPPEKLASAS
jgi:hypothetical protein